MMQDPIQLLKSAAMGKTTEAFHLLADAMSQTGSKAAHSHEPAARGYGYRRTNHFKTVNGRRFQLHATRGWKCVGRVE